MKKGWRNTTTDDWFALDVPAGMDLDSAGIYEWRIEGVRSDVGMSNRLSRRLNDYVRNIRKIATGEPYRKNKPDAFRDIHRDLAAARDNGLKVTFAVLENCEPGLLTARRQFWKEERVTLNR